MSAKNRFGKAGDAARTAQENPYLQRLIEDDELRSSLMSAYSSARSAYGRMTNGKPATKALFEDQKLQQEITDAIDALRQAGSALSEPPRHARTRGGGGGFGRSLMLLAVGAVLALALSEGLRSKILDVLFGAEEEFDYSSTTAPATPAPAGVAGS